MATGSQKRIVGGLILISVSMALAFGLYFFRQALANPGLPVIGQVKHFELTDSSGHPFDSQSLYRNVWIASKFSLPCKETCADMMKNKAALSRTFEQIPALKLISITGPLGESFPEELAAYQNTLVMGKGNWFFLTGQESGLEQLFSQPLAVVPRLSENPDVQLLTLIDRSGYIRGYYDGTRTADVNQLFLDATKLLKERF